MVHENYRIYLEKVKVVIKIFDPSYNQTNRSEIRTLKNLFKRELFSSSDESILKN